MQVLTTIAQVRAARAALDTVGFVPTMGFLHEGHLSLVRQAKTECDAVAVSIFVNPTQFGPNEDLSRYPRDMDRDLALLKAEGVDFVFTPEAAEIYPAGAATTVEVGAIADVLEGAVRPGHFAGVATVVTKLFNIVTPTVAWFGQKDAQQCAVIRQITRDLDLPVEIKVGRTVREADGLAMSSRNVYLDPEQRRAATVLYRALSEASAAFDGGERSGNALRAVITGVLAEEPSGLADYISVADPLTLAEVDVAGDTALASLAVRFGATRLIDNVVLGAAG